MSGYKFCFPVVDLDGNHLHLVNTKDRPQVGDMYIIPLRDTARGGKDTQVVSERLEVARVEFFFSRQGATVETDMRVIVRRAPKQ